ncbi:MAG: efflux RND transporter periplasmic adaptor subunit [Gammaproteobacteria bacterium]
MMAGCSQESVGKSNKKPKAHLVEAVRVNLSPVAVQRVRTGTLRARREVKIHNQEDGEVIKLPYFEGDRVKKGDMVVRLDDKLLRAQLTRAQATRHQAQQDLNRVRDLFKKKLVSDEQLNRAETALEVAQADEKVLQTRLSYTTIKSPLDGIVSERLSEPGNIAERYTHLLTISDPTSLVTEVTVSELLISKLAVDQLAQVTVDALGDKTFHGRISRIFPNLDPVTRRGTVEVELRPVPKGARPGQLCRVTLTTQAAQRLVIPFSALRRDQSGAYVFTVDDNNVVHRSPVVGGLRIDEQVEILKGLDQGQRVVTKGFLDLAVGKQVKVVPTGNGDAGNGQKSTGDKNGSVTPLTSPDPSVPNPS